MNYTYSILLFFYFLLLPIIGFAQNQAELDSLQQLLDANDDKVKEVLLLLNIGAQYDYNIPQKALEYCIQAKNLAEELVCK